MLWANDHKKGIKIRSPLSRYLKEQRKDLDLSGEWQPQFGNIIAKDYAVFARFKDIKNKDKTSEGFLYDYFIAGIRGLGTWGATWYLDRNYKQIPIDDNEENDVQILLEVIFRDDTIYDVRDVSDEPASYFEKENSINEIRKKIQKYKETRHID